MFRFARYTVLLFAMMIGIIPLSTRATQTATIIYVVSGGAGEQNGTSWANAKDLQAALQSASAGSELWVKQGTYKPTTSTDRSIAFVLKNDVAVYGGFKGDETQLSQRNFNAYTSTLSGNIGDENSAADNSQHVVVTNGVTNTAILDGFTVRDGYANTNGGGIYNDGGSPTLRNLVLLNNSGQAIYSNNAQNMILETATIQNNGGVDGCAGLLSFASNIHFNTVTMQQNYGNGSAICTYNSTLQLRNSVVRNHYETERHAAMYNEGSNISIISSSFISNTAHIENRATTMTITQSYLTGSTREAIYQRQGTLNIYQSVFRENSPNPECPVAGSDLVVTQARFALIQSTIANNTQCANAQIALSNQAQGLIANSILWGKSPNGVITSTSTLTVAHSLMRNAPQGNGNITSDPLFADSSLHLSANSPAIDAGNSALIPPDTADLDNDGNITEPLPIDLAGNKRVSGAGLDIGAFERQVQAMFKLWLPMITR